MTHDMLGLADMIQISIERAQQLIEAEENTFALLKWIMENPEGTGAGSRGAASVFKGIAQREAIIQKEAGSLD